MMDRAEKDETEQGKRNEDPTTYNSHGVSLDWSFCNTNVPMNLVSPGNILAVCKESEMGSSSAAMEPFAAAHWDHPANVQNLGYCDINVQGISNALGTGKVGPWNPHISMLKEGMFLQNAPDTTIPESLTQFPTDSGFIERAARFSCFSGGNFSDMVNPYSIHESMGLYHGGGGIGVRIPGPREVFSGGQPHRTEVSVGETSKEVILASEGSPLKNGGISESNARSNDEARQNVAASANDSDEAEFSGGGGQDDAATYERPAGEPSSRRLSSKRRKRNGSAIDSEADATVARHPSDDGKDSDETQARTDPTPDSVVEKSSGKNNKQGSQPSDPPKEYIHVRARRGQATNSHSLAERVRREKISERMKFLQDLVPGCSKVTGKAVMLDEIINYVQSLQRQVEFLSMKLATVNPRVEFNLEGLLPKDILQSRPGPSSTLGFFPDMSMVYVHPSGGLIQGGVHATVNPDAMRRTVPGQMTPTAGGFKEAAQMLNMWDNELDHVLHMGFPSNSTSNSKDVDGTSVQPNHTKIKQ